MRLLLDTHILLWWLGGNDRLPAAVKDAVAEPQNDVWVSSVSIAEIAVKVRIGKLKLDGHTVASVAAAVVLSFRELNFTLRHATRLAELPLLHRDPFDRMLIAQSLEENLVLVTVDPEVPQYGVATFA